MNDLIKIEEHEGQQTVNARDLWRGLESKQDFSTWIKARLDGFAEGRDYLLHSFMEQQPSGAKSKIDYYLTIDTAKHVAMLERNDKGREVRAYFIEVEQAWNTPELVFARALQAANQVIEASRKRISVLEPKAAFFDQVADSKTALQMRDVAAALNPPGWGRNKIFQFLRDHSIFDDRNIPYRQYQDSGYFRVIEQTWTDPAGETHVSLKTLVYQKGIDYIRRQIVKLEGVTAWPANTPATLPSAIPSKPTSRKPPASSRPSCSAPADASP